MEVLQTSRGFLSCWLSVPKILTLFIPEILSHPAIAGRAKTLSVPPVGERSEEHTSELQSQSNLVCRLLLEKKKKHTGRSCPKQSVPISLPPWIPVPQSS